MNFLSCKANARDCSVKSWHGPHSHPHKLGGFTYNLQKVVLRLSQSGLNSQTTN